MAKTQIVLDADVIIHFAKAGWLAFLPNILSEYEHVVLSYVKDEILYAIRHALDNQMALLKNIKLLPFEPKGEMAREYAKLHSKLGLGKGESACMAYCKFTNNAIGSSNLSDIKDYCDQNQIVYLTTCDFLYYAWKRNKMTEDDIKTFVQSVREHNSILPDFDVTRYVPHIAL